MKCYYCLCKGRKSFAYFKIDGVGICIPCFLKEPKSPAELERNRLRNEAWAEVARARYQGKIKKQPCEICGTKIMVDGHHEDYSKPLELRWLCRKHHNLVNKGKIKLVPIGTSTCNPSA